MAFLPPAAPKSLLGRHRLLAPSASVRVSPLCLGGMSMIAEPISVPYLEACTNFDVKALGMRGHSAWES